MLSKCFVACNIYISAGLPRYGPFLIRLLEDAQQQCLNSQQLVAVVHAFSDVSYDRSSFHLAGTPMEVASVASKIASQVLKELPLLKETAEGSSTKDNLEHPQVGLVDHISILPLAEHNSHPLMTLEEWAAQTKSDLSQTSTNKASNDMPLKILPSGWAARFICHELDSLVHVLFYGHAHVEGKSLATVRRESTSFFCAPSTACPKVSYCTIGATPEFVENYNIRLAPEIDSKKTAQALTRWVRERDGGLPFVEALSLPYSQGRYEVACNLLNPKVTSAQTIDERVNDFMKMEKSPSLNIETSYRVGTTEQQCLRALEDIESNKGNVKKYNADVLKQFQSYF
jgi:glutamate formiminotransferase